MSISIPGRVVVFDYGEVISLSPSKAARTTLEMLVGVGLDGRAPTAEQFWASYGEHREALDHGRLSVTEYWTTIARDIGVTLTASRIHELWYVDFSSWLTPETGTVDLIERLHEGGTRLAILSNAGFDFGSPFRSSPLGAFFERVFVSAELDDLKPAASIYEHVLTELGTSAADTVFIDNKKVNVDAAEALGITGHVFTTPAELESFLQSLATAS
ncbi:HAD family hydrolase [Frigoribacterium sp. 2-23]|uniref:HAD family hydrolase n=1 Tax=Frigoribacterium sp. 2-23 TaxID=3415006 RepID=UPI003C700CC0